MSSERTLIRVDISIDQPWAIGAAPDLQYRPADRDGDDDGPVRLPVQRDPLGRCLLPATSLVGGLKDHLGESAGRSWLGSGDGDSTVPSELRCLAATIIGAPTTPARITTTAIDPVRRAAKAHTLRSEEVLEPGVVIWWLEWDHHDRSLILDELIAELSKWRPVVGRRRSANRGRGHVTAVHYRTFDLTDETDLTWWLAERPAFEWRAETRLNAPEWKTRNGSDAATAGELLLKCPFRVEDALHIGGAGVRFDNDHREIRCTAGALAGTSWRGVFRHRVEHIVRVTDGDQSAVGRLFGTGRAAGASENAGQRGQLRFGDSVVNGATRTRTHVAIDRISGGAAQLSGEDPLDDKGLLFTLDYFGAGATLDLIIYNDSDDAVSEEDRRLLTQVLRDIDEGVIGVGGMTSRGYGTLKCCGEKWWGR